MRQEGRHGLSRRGARQMTQSTELGIAAVLAAILGAVVTYLVARRAASGKIATSEATTLWGAAEQMRQELRAEVLALRAEVLALRAEAVLTRTQVARLERRLVEYGKDGKDGSDRNGG